jgi:uncharacterized protein YlxW (UPF0749 family)
MGLLDYITSTSLDGDYAEASKRRQAAAERDGATEPGVADGADARTRPSAGAGVATAVLALFGLLVATAFVQTARTADDAEARHGELVELVVARKDQLGRQRDRVQALRRETETLENVFLEATAQGRSLQSRLSTLGLLTGADPARGPGVRAVVDDGPPASGDDGVVLDVDLQKLANGLWLAGAESIAINGQRLTSLSAIREGGGVVTVNYRRIAAPYTVNAIGDPDRLAARFIDTPGGQWWLDLQALYGVEFEIDRVESLTLPAASRLDLRHAHTPETLR